MAFKPCENVLQTKNFKLNEWREKKICSTSVLDHPDTQWESMTDEWWFKTIRSNKILEHHSKIEEINTVKHSFLFFRPTVLSWDLWRLWRSVHTCTSPILSNNNFYSKVRWDWWSIAINAFHRAKRSLQKEKWNKTHGELKPNTKLNPTCRSRKKK